MNAEPQTVGIGENASDFVAKVNGRVAMIDYDEEKISQNSFYRPSSAADAYESQHPWHVACEKVNLRYGLWDYLDSQLRNLSNPYNPSSEDVRRILKEMSDQSSQYNVKFLSIKSGQSVQDNNKTYIMPDYAAGIHYSTLQPRHRVVRGKRLQVFRSLATERQSSTSLILIKDEIIDSHPWKAIITAAHELGHHFEENNGRLVDREVDKHDRREYVYRAATEYYSTLFPLKLSLNAAKLSSSQEVIDNAAHQVAFYNRVVFGQSSI